MVIQMILYMVKSHWQEKKGFSIDRQNIGAQYIFVHFLTPVTAYLKNEYKYIRPGGCVIWEMNHPQRFKSPDCILIHDWFHADPSCSELMNKYNLECEKVYYPSDSGEITRLISEIEIEQVKRASFYIEVSTANIEKIFAYMARSLKDENPIYDSEQREELINVRTKVHADYLHDWSVREMAELAALSESRFYAVYKEIFGISPTKDLCNTRIQRAQILLTSTGCSVEKAAELCGYKNQYHFIRQFKQCTGTTPGQYRRDHIEIKP